jgi:hypothetical protein
MNNTFSISAVLSVLTGLMLLAVWGNIQVYAQPSSSVSAADSSSATSPQVKAIMCDPSNPSLKVVNTTEAHICGIPKTVKPSLSSSTPPTPAVSSTTTTTQQTTKPSVNPIVSTPSKQQEITTTGRNVADNTRIAPISNPATKQLSSSTTTTIAPQAIHQQQQQQQEQQPQPQILPLTATSNNTITLNNTLSTASPLLGPGKLTFLGFHGSGSTHSSSSSSDTKSSSSSKNEHSSDTKSSSSSKNEHSSDTKSTHSHSTSSSSSHAKSSSHSDHGSKSSSSAGLSIGDKVRSIIRHALD